MNPRRVLNKVAAWLLLVCLIVVPSVARVRQWQEQREIDEQGEGGVALAVKQLPSRALSDLGFPERCDITRRLESGFLIEDFTAPRLLKVGPTLVANAEGALCGYRNGSLMWKLGSSFDRGYLVRDGKDVIATWDDSPAYARVDADSGLVTARMNKATTLESEPVQVVVVAVSNTLRVATNDIRGTSTVQFESACELIEVSFFSNAQIEAVGDWMYMTSEDHESLLGFDATQPNRAGVLTAAFGTDDTKVTKRC